MFWTRPSLPELSAPRPPFGHVFCDVAIGGKGIEGKKSSCMWAPGGGGSSCLPRVLPETKILTFKAQTFEIHQEKCFELGWVVGVFFFKGKIASLIKEIVWFLWPVLLRKLGSAKFPWTVRGCWAQGHCRLRTKL